jgi:large subunit ribosomal protein L2
MGKRLKQQRRGKGASNYRVPNYAFSPKLAFKNMDGRVEDIVHDPRRDAPLAEIAYSDKTVGHLVAMEGMSVGDSISGIVMRLEDVKEGSQISNIETYPNSGPKLCRSPGTFGVIVSKTGKDCVIQLPSKKTRKFSLDCRAMIGIPAGEGAGEKPYLKAGAMYKLKHARGKHYPSTSAVSKNAVDHPYGGSGSGKVKKPVSRNAPPGQKVGSVAPRRSGRKKA